MMSFFKFVFSILRPAERFREPSFRNFSKDYPSQVEPMSFKENACKIAVEIWKRGVFDDQIINGKRYDGGRNKIMQIILEGGGKFWRDWVIRTGGYSEKRRKGKDGKWYPGVKWCGFFVGACFPDLDKDIRLYVIGSCRRLEMNWHKTKFKKPKRVDPKNIEPGDIVVINNDKSFNDPWGDHITLAVSTTQNGVFRTIEGNAFGQSTSGQHVEGVVKNQRQIEEVFAVYRLTKEMMNG